MVGGKIIGTLLVGGKFIEVEWIFLYMGNYLWVT